MPKSNVEIVQSTYEKTIQELRVASKALIETNTQSLLLKDKRVEQIMDKCKEIIKTLDPDRLQIEINVSSDRYSPLIKIDYKKNQQKEEQIQDE